VTILQGRVTSGRRQFSSEILLALAAVLGTFCLLELSARVWLTRIADDEAFVRYASIPQLERRFGEGLLDLAAQLGQARPRRQLPGRRGAVRAQHAAADPGLVSRPSPGSG